MTLLATAQSKGKAIKNSIMSGKKNPPITVAAASRRKARARLGKTPTLADRFRSAARENLRRFLLRFLILDQLIQVLGNVQTRSASSKESEIDQPDHVTQEFF